MKKGIWAGIVALLLAGVSQSATTVTDSGSTVETITSLDQIERIVRDTQRQFWQVVPPSTDDPFYLHPERIIRIVDWNSKAWPKSFLKQMYAEMVTVGAAGSMYPIYYLAAVEDRSGNLVYFNSYNNEVFRVSAPKDYNPYLFAFMKYGVGTADALSDQQKLFGRSSNVSVEILLLDKSFASLYEKDAATDTTAMRLATEPVGTMESSLMMTTYSFPEFPGGGGSSTNGGGSVTNNPIVTLKFQVPTNFGHYAEIFAKENLNTRLWQVAENRMAVTAGTELVWTDLTSSNVPVRFYLLSNPEIDTDSDGYSDGRERYVTDTQTNTYNYFDSDFDGMHDWFETMYFGNLDRDGSEDFDGDGLANAEEMVLTATNVVVHSDPTLFDTDGGGIDDGFETTNTLYGLDPLNPDDDTADMDFDGLSNHEEYIRNTSLNNPDSDGDGITDGMEVEWGGSGYADTNGIVAHPLVANAWDWESDSDGDGLTLQQEVTNGTNPGDPSDGNQTNSVVDVALTLGNHSGNFGYGYTLTLSGPTITPLESEPDSVATKIVKLQKGKSYAFSLTRKENQSSCGAPSKACTVLISGKDLAFNDPNLVRGVHPDDDSMDSLLSGGGATGLVHAVSVSVDSSSLTVDASNSAIVNENGLLDIWGYAKWSCTLVVSPSAAKNNVDVRMVQTIKGNKQKVLRNPSAGSTGVVQGSSSFIFDGQNPKAAWLDPGAFYIIRNSDTPETGDFASVFSAIHQHLQFEDFIQYKVDGGTWTTLQKATWKTDGDGYATPDGQGGFTASGVNESVVTSPFTTSSDIPVEPPPAFKDLPWEDY